MKRKRKVKIRERITNNYLMQRFIREIEREDALVARNLETILVFQPVRTK